MHDEREIIDQLNGYFPRGTSVPPAPPTYGISGATIAPAQINPARDPVALASMTVRAVDQIGEAAAVEIDQAADEIEAGARAIAAKLRRLSAAMREHSRIAGADVEEFGKLAIGAVELVRELQGQIGRKPEFDEAPE